MVAGSKCGENARQYYIIHPLGVDSSRSREYVVVQKLSHRVFFTSMKIPNSINSNGENWVKIEDNNNIII